MSAALAYVLAGIVGLSAILAISAITEPPWELFRPNLAAKDGRERFGYFVEIILALVVFAILSGIALAGLLSI
jgi:hypothetical protein